MAVTPHNTSQDCSNCDRRVQKSLSTRTHKCPHCGHVQDRDWNAAINILKKALEILANLDTDGQSEINVCGENDKSLTRETQSSKLTRRSRKSKGRSLESPPIPTGWVGRMSIRCDRVTPVSPELIYDDLDKR